MKALKKAWIFLLLVCLAALFSTTALADDDNIKSGTCGDNLTWTLNTDTGALTISGTGEMTSSPWRGYGETVRSVTIGNGVTTIGNNAFYGCTGLTSVTIPDSVTSIGSDAFYGCTALASVTIPDSVTSIGSGAFWDCTNLTSVTIGNGVTSIGSRAFCGCTGLTSVTIPVSVVSIGRFAFDECSSLTEILVSAENTMYSSKDGVLFNKGRTELVRYPSGKGTSYVIPDSVTTIGDYAFNGCTGLTSVTIGNGVTSIGDWAFWNCTGLTSVTIPVSVTTISQWAFQGCTGLTDVYYGGSEDDWNAIEIGSYNGYLTSATIHYNSLTDIDDTDDEPTSPATPGDLNGDGEVDASDLTILARHVGKVETMEDETALANADVTGDGNVDASDLTKLAQYVGKIISSLD